MLSTISQPHWGLWYKNSFVSRIQPAHCEFRSGQPRLAMDEARAACGASAVLWARLGNQPSPSCSLSSGPAWAAQARRQAGPRETAAAEVRSEARQQPAGAISCWDSEAGMRTEPDSHEYFFSLICAVYSACLVALPEHNWDRQCLAEIQTIWFWSSIGYNFAANLGSLII